MTDVEASDLPTTHEQGAGARSANDLPPPAPLNAGAALFLDFDGTLTDIVDHPDDVRVAEGLAALIEALSVRLHGRVAIVTGRSIAALESLLGPVQVAVAGSHGGEFRAAAGGPVDALAEPLHAAVENALHDFARAHGGLLVEPKPYSMAVHYRHHPEARDALLACAQGLAADHGMALKHGKQVVELAMPGSDKGTAVTRFMGLPAFAGTTPLFLGDDVTDEDAFRAVADLGGQGILVGAMRSTAAVRRLPDVAAVHSWLKAGLDALERPDAVESPNALERISRP